MSKRIISIVLFAAMLLSLAGVANAADTVPVEVKPTGVAWVALANLNPYDTYTASVYPPGSAMGVLVPNAAAGNRLVITGPIQNIQNKEYHVAVVFNGKLDVTKDFVAVNGSYLDLSKAANYGETADGFSTVYTTFTANKNVYAPATTYDKTFQVKVVKDGGVSFTYDFVVEFVDGSFTPYAMMGIDGLDYSTALGDFVVGVFSPNPYWVDPAAAGTAAGSLLDWAKRVQYVRPTIEEVIANTEYTFGYANAYVKTGGDRLNIRASATADSSIVGKLANGEKIFVATVFGNWALIVSADGTTIGYVYTKYIAY